MKCVVTGDNQKSWMWAKMHVLALKKADVVEFGRNVSSYYLAPNAVTASAMLRFGSSVEWNV